MPDKLEKVARAMCKAKGENPDEKFLSREQQHEVVAPGHERWFHPWLENWTKYEADARAFIAAHEALIGDE